MNSDYVVAIDLRSRNLVRLSSQIDVASAGVGLIDVRAHAVQVVLQEK